MSSELSLSVSSTPARRADEYARELQAFCRGDSIPREVLNRRLGLANFLLRKPVKYCHGPCVILNKVAGILGTPDVSHYVAARIANALAEQMRRRLPPNAKDISMMEDIIERVTMTLLEKCVELVPIVEIATEKQIQEFDPTATRDRINRAMMDGNQSGETYSAALQELQQEFETAVLTRRHIIAVTSLLRVLLDHTSTIVDKVVKEIPDAECATTCAWGFSTLVTGGAFVGSFTTAFAALPLGAPTKLAIRCASGALGIVSGGKTVQKGMNLHEVRKECTNQFNLDLLDQQTKAFCSFIGYIFQHMMVLEHLSSDEYIDLVRELNQTLPNNIEDWSNPEYVSTYVGTGMDSICSSVNEVIGGLARLGIAEPGPLVS